MCRGVWSVTPSGSLVDAGALWGLGDDPALRARGPLLSQEFHQMQNFEHLLLLKVIEIKS